MIGGRTCEFSFELSEDVLTILAARMKILTNHHFRAPCIFLLAVVLGLGAPRAAEDEPPASPEVTAAMQPFLDSYKLAGVIGIIADKNGKIHYRNTLGYADVERKRPMSEDSVCWIASMTKMFAGASIMMLVDEGKVSLDDPVTRFIPQLEKWMVVAEKDQSHVLLKPLARPVTVRHVLSHTSGLTGSSELHP
jgi:CubicO group peptidase (beta-lactamase class C family)